MSSSAFTPSTTTVTNNVPVNVPVVEASQLITATVTNNGSISGQRVNISRVGDKLFFEGSINFSGAGSAAKFQLNMPTGLTIDTSKIDSGTGAYGNHIGTAGWWDNGVGSKQLMPWVDTSTRIAFAIHGAFVNLQGSDLANGDSITFALFLPIAEWAGSGTTTLATRAVEEYASNSSTSDASDTTSFVYGPNGATTPGPLTAYRTKRVRFQTPILSTDSIYLEGRASLTSPWAVVQALDGGNGLSPLQLQAGVYYGIGLNASLINSTDIDVSFGRYAFSNGATYGAAGAAWSTSLGYWRVRKVSSGAQVGYPVSARNIVGDTSGSVVPVGMLGEQLTQSRLAASALNVATNTTTNVTATALTLTAGVWDLSGFIGVNGSATSVTQIFASISTTSATLGSQNDSCIIDGSTKSLATSDFQSSLPVYRVNISSNTTYYLVARILFSGGGNTANVFGRIQATRIA